MNLLTINSGEGYSLFIVVCDTRTCARIGGILVCVECDAFRSCVTWRTSNVKVKTCINTVHYAHCLWRRAAFNEQTAAA